MTDEEWLEFHRTHFATTMRLLEAARAGMRKAKWSLGDPDHVLLLPIISHLLVEIAPSFVGPEVELRRDAEVRSAVAQELREAAARHPEGTARRAALLEAADMAERRSRDGVPDSR